MSRLDDEFIMALVRNRSGQDSGDLDFQINVNRFEKLSEYELLILASLIEQLLFKCHDRRIDLRQSPKD